MYDKRFKLLILLLTGAGLGWLHAQGDPLKIHGSTLSSGGTAAGSGGSASYSVGQLFYTEKQGSGYSVLAGVQVPYEIYEVTGIEDTREITLAASIFPNPVRDILILKTGVSESISEHSFSFILFDMNGKILENRKIESIETEIIMAGYPPSSYFLKITENKKEVKIFTIIKN